MKIFDIHVHCANIKPNPKLLIERLEATGVFGCMIFSNNPLEFSKETGTSFEARLDEILAWTHGFETRLFPVLWIHPDEENLKEKLHIAKEKGVCAFKMICDNYFVYEERVLDILREIALLNLPVIFHSGILWDSKVSSIYNRPVNWEALLEIPGLRFSLGHCSWPWIDECIALYGKFLNAYTTKENAAEMFFDITPGTPPIYREELLTKLYTIGYDMGDNIIFGSDSSSHDYKSDWTKNWLETDRRILDKLGVSYDNREKLYNKNLMRFLGKSNIKILHKSPVPDDSNTWSAENKGVYPIIEKWYKKLEFPHIYDDEFYDALKNIKISDAISIETYDLSEQDGKRNLLSFLYFCENLKKRYEEAGIDEEILMGTINDIKIWCEIWSEIKGGLYLGELPWLSHTFKMKLFKIGSLEYYMGVAGKDFDEYGISKGDNVIEVHIPKGSDLSAESFKKSIEMAKNFFEKYYPGYKYEYFTCHSWLMDPTLKEFLKPESKIMQFQSMFKIIAKDKHDSILRYTFKWNTTKETLESAHPTSSFAEKVKKHVLSGGDFYEGYGIIKK